MKLIKVLLPSIFLAINSTSYAFHIDGSYSEVEIREVEMTMDRTNESLQALQHKKTDTDGVSVHKLKVEKNMKMEMKSAENSTQCGNYVESTSSKGGIWQQADVDGKLIMKQTGGKGNTQAVNCINVETK
ncbi:hypothetical protein [Candidatus Venteria ishoeyi]|uniref:Uncharacterized protein n=1 Tax=Candidatus Venteria ishoeyi TaxID=1899563 RepID=A0A1H6F7C9_9GAMM|nr:hypothetical protein [Candidatus Venteria ishoeyi]SEH05443.1 Uncharacterised protein [Candidatus Venteria ishoeyi]